MTLPPELAAETASWSPAQKAALVERLTREAVRMATDQQYPTAGALAQRIDSKTVQTPAMDVIDDALEWALTTPNARLIVSLPPQQGKSQRLSIWGVIRALVQDPARRVVIASYSDALARNHARAARDIIRGNGSTAKDPLTGADLPDHLGIALAGDHAASGSWRLAGHRGGCYAVGVGGSLTGSPADVLFIDDPLKGMQEADSQIERDKVITWWETVAQTRLAPGAPVVVIMTRWHAKDLAGHVLSQDAARPADQRRWRVVNIPAIATPHVLDALGREPGTPLESTRGHTLADWERIREEVGPRAWSALYLGTPTPGEGGLFSQDWFDRHRLPELPTTSVRLVSIDPAETGRSDEAGLLAMSATSDGRVCVTDDWSGRMQSDQWARQAVILALTTGATEVLFEAFTTGPTYERVIKQAWRQVRDDARVLRAADGVLEIAIATIAGRTDPPADPRQAVLDIDGLTVPDQDDPPFRIHPWRAKGDKTARAAGTRQAASTGRLRMVGTHPTLESQAAHWQQGQASPDRLDAMVNGYERVMQLIGGQATIAVPGQPTGQTAPAAPAPFSFGAPMPSGL
ncbi:MAG: terminase family protein [Dietzia sp.]|nr:terminase family protein [Dietzia sp.]